MKSDLNFLIGSHALARQRSRTGDRIPTPTRIYDTTTFKCGLESMTGPAAPSHDTEQLQTDTEEVLRKNTKKQNRLRDGEPQDWRQTH